MLAKVGDTWHRDTDLLLTEAVAVARVSVFALSPSGPICFGWYEEGQVMPEHTVCCLTWEEYQI